MKYLLVRHKVADYDKWRPVYDAHAGTREKNGVREKQVFRDAKDPHQVFLLLEVLDLAKAEAFLHSSELQHAMKDAGVTDVPGNYFLD